MSYHLVFLERIFSTHHITYLIEVMQRTYAMIDRQLMRAFQKRVLRELHTYDISRPDLIKVLRLLKKCEYVIDLATRHAFT